MTPNKKRQKKDHKDHNIEQVSVQSSVSKNGDAISSPQHQQTHTGIPQSNVLDLRSIVARKEIEKKRRDQKLEDEQQKIHAKKTHSSKKITTSLFSFFRTPLTPQSKKEDAPAVVQHKKIKKSTQPTTTFFSSRVSGIHHKIKKAVSRRNHPDKQKKKKQSPVSHWIQHNRFITPEALKPLGIFFLLSLIFIVPVSVSAMLRQAQEAQTIITDSTEEAFIHLQEAGAQVQEFDFTSAQSQFGLALQSFQNAQSEIDQFNAFFVTLATYIPGKGETIESGMHVVQAGQELSAAGEQMTKTLAVLNSAHLNNTDDEQQQSLTDLLVIAHSGLTPTVEHLKKANEEIQQVSIDVVPQDKQQLFLLAQKTLPQLQRTVESSLDVSELLLAFLGHEEDKRYVVLFTNNREMRPTGGGFPGSLGIFDISQGIVTKSDIPGGGIYDIAGQSQVQVISPQPLHLINPHWNIQDALWFPHYPTSAQKVEWFLDHTNNGVSVDGVISLTPNVVEQLLRITGPIDMTEEFGVQIDADNFYDIVQTQAEKKFDEDPESKRIISELTPKLLTAVIEATKKPESLVQILTTFKTSLDEKDILLYANDEEVQQMFSQQNWSGELMNTDRDYLHINIANIGGGKTSQVLDHSANLNTEIQEDGSIINTLTFQSVHTGDSSNAFENVTNNSFVRLYIPKGSEVLSATGFDYPNPKLFFTPESDYTVDKDLAAISGEISINPLTGIYTNTEFNKEVIGGWIETPVHESSTITVQYRLPFTVNSGGIFHSADHYSLFIQKQPGIDMTVNAEVKLPSNVAINRSYPQGYNGQVHTVLKRDFFGGVVLENK